MKVHVQTELALIKKAQSVAQEPNPVHVHSEVPLQLMGLIPRKVSIGLRPQLMSCG